ncbi:MAG: YraN family protein [Anaerolineaceae bacterium]|nr:YraN family protein [Anaerolineaceae bacterium]
MTKPKQATGQRGEHLARTYLQERAYTIVETNWHCPEGEIDIVARKEGVWVFVEVRTRHANITAPALESIGGRKQQRMALTAQRYLAEHHLDVDWRVDVVAVALPASGMPVIEHYEDALGW